MKTHQALFRPHSLDQKTRDNMKRPCCLITLLLILHENGRNSVFACGGMGTNQTSHEEVTIKENTQADLRCNLRTENSETSKESAFVIEMRLCDNGKYHDVCRCRWLPDKDAVCKNQRNVSICEADNNEMRFSVFVKRTYSDILWELYRSNATPVVIKKTRLQVMYPAKVTGLQVNGQEVTETHVVDENQEVIVSCFFINGNPPVTIRLVDSTGQAQSSTTHGVEPLVIFLGVFRCQEVWPIIKCEATGSELNRSVAIIGRCKYHTR
ncbi:uncharacterized protein LOC112567917 isoform X2 [Pomacea canaliculata]|uniref:uncharacterized protein LOC112567917 isoform X2 n=1 Tax=Pomacea canaliculata TaxID=400727 RepID=UPI000D72708C|nr:uncharacterized protein LOC112567917 isoform X2 [Pomacea canaliculata]